MDHDAVKVARDRALLAPQGNTTQPVANSNATQLAAGAASTTSQHGDVTQLADGTVPDGTAADAQGACGSGDQPPHEPQLQPPQADLTWTRYEYQGRYWWHNEGANTWYWEEQPPHNAAAPPDLSDERQLRKNR